MSDGGRRKARLALGALKALAADLHETSLGPELVDGVREVDRAQDSIATALERAAQLFEVILAELDELEGGQRWKR